jgi:hypothetical protein
LRPRRYLVGWEEFAAEAARPIQIDVGANLPRAQAHEIDQALARLAGIGRAGKSKITVSP